MFTMTCVDVSGATLALTHPVKPGGEQMEPLTIMATTLAAVYTAYKAATDLGYDKTDDE